MPGQDKPRSDIALEGRGGEVYRLHAVNRLTQSEIGARLGISQQRVSQILAEVREQIKSPDLLAMREEALRRHEDIMRRAFKLAELDGAPVTAGKDGDIVRDPETDEVVRDYALRLNALALALKTDAETRKLLGLDAASKSEVTGTVKVEIVGVDPEDLT